MWFRRIRSKFRWSCILFGLVIGCYQNFYPILLVGSAIIQVGYLFIGVDNPENYTLWYVLSGCTFDELVYRFHGGTLTGWHVAIDVNCLIFDKRCPFDVIDNYGARSDIFRWNNLSIWWCVCWYKYGISEADLYIARYVWFLYRYIAAWNSASWRHPLASYS